MKDRNGITIYHGNPVKVNGHAKRGVVVDAKYNAEQFVTVLFDNDYTLDLHAKSLTVLKGEE